MERNSLITGFKFGFYWFRKNFIINAWLGETGGSEGRDGGRGKKGGKGWGRKEGGEGEKFPHHLLYIGTFYR